MSSSRSVDSTRAPTGTGSGSSIRPIEKVTWGGMAAAMPISETRYGEPFSRSAILARSWSEVALMITSARTFGSIRSIAVEIPRLA